MSIEKTHDKIDMVYDKVKSMGLTFGEHATKERLADSTIETYRHELHRFADWLHDKHGISDIGRVKPRHAYEYVQNEISAIKNGEGSFFTLYKFPHAIESFRQAATATKVYKIPIKIGDKRQILSTFKAHDLKREYTKSTSMKPSQSNVDRVINDIEKSNSPQSKTIANVCRFQTATGGRIAASLRVKAGDVVIVSVKGKEVAVVSFHNDKGGLSRRVMVMNPQDVAFLKGLKGSKRDGAPLFQVKNRGGKDKNNNLSAKQVKAAVARSAKRLGINTPGKRFTTHSFRKRFAQKQYDNRMSKSKKQLEKEVARRINEDAGLKRKFNNMVNEINRKRNTPRQPTREELARWLTSVDLGHGRLGVMAYYIDRKKSKKAS